MRFIAFGSEELGLRGSRHYVNSLSDEEISSTLIMMNFDALATGPQVGVIGDHALADQLVDSANASGIDTQRVFRLTGGSSDHASFRAAGIPFVFFMADDFSRIHTPQDTLDFAQPELLGGSAALGVTLLDMLADE